MPVLRHARKMWGKRERSGIKQSTNAARHSGRPQSSIMSYAIIGQQMSAISIRSRRYIHREVFDVGPEVPGPIQGFCERIEQPSFMHFACSLSLRIKLTPVSNTSPFAKSGLSNCHSRCSVSKTLRTTNLPLAILASSFSATVKVTIVLSSV